jgi:putative membrane protein
LGDNYVTESIYDFIGGTMVNMGIIELIIVLFIIGILVLLGVLVVVAVSGNRARWQAKGPQSAREILDARYAKGEISKEQYEQMRRDLEG